ncbi:MAG: metallopeptidase [Verrucomicrobiales bacterium]
MLWLLVLSPLWAAEEKKEAGKVRFDPVQREIEGWTVHIDPALLEGDGAEEGARALRMLADHLHRISLLVEGEPLKKLRRCEIWIEKNHPTLRPMQYHPSVEWLRAHGHDPRLAKKVHITQASALVARSQLLQHPAVVLHELAHAYHDQFLGFDHAALLKCYGSAMARGKYEKVLNFTGREMRHYGASNHKEYFAEATEAYFWRNDFFPFVRAELERFDPALHAELEKIWGPAR